jgi:hypothetical protein
MEELSKSLYSDLTNWKSLCGLKESDKIFVENPRASGDGKIKIAKVGIFRNLFRHLVKFFDPIKNPEHVVNWIGNFQSKTFRDLRSIKEILHKDKLPHHEIYAKKHELLDQIIQMKAAIKMSDIGLEKMVHSYTSAVNKNSHSYKEEINAKIAVNQTLIEEIDELIKEISAKI